MTEETTIEELLDWLCWVWATEAERFYPPDETANECLEELESGTETLSERTIGEEHGYHKAMLLTAQLRFNDLERRGFDPEKRAEREVARAREDGLDLEDIDWSWRGDSDD